MVILSKNITLCKSMWKKGTGLMFRKPGKNFAYVFEFSRPKILMITMVFVFFPIDILFIKNGLIVEVAKNVKPFSHYTPKQLADAFIEFPNGKLRRSMVGKKINWNSRIVEIVDE